MTPEELLKPRYKVIADYPGNLFNVGYIHDKNDVLGFMLSNFSPIDFSKYPVVFKKLEWWEERKESDMPEYVKWVHDGKIHKVFQWLKSSNGAWLCDIDGNKILDKNVYAFLSDISISIATKEEYENQK